MAHGVVALKLLAVKPRCSTSLLLYDRVLHALHGWRGDEELRVDVIRCATSWMRSPTWSCRAPAAGQHADATMRPACHCSRQQLSGGRQPWRHGFAGDQRQLVGVVRATTQSWRRRRRCGGGPSNHDGRRRQQHLRDRAARGGGPSFSPSNCARCDGATRWSRRRRRSRQRWGSTCTCSWRNASGTPRRGSPPRHRPRARRRGRHTRHGNAKRRRAFGGGAHRDDSREVLARWATAPPGKRTGTRARLAGMEPLSSCSVAVRESGASCPKQMA